MDTKLTLKLDKVVIEKAKDYAAKQNISLSKLIESYLRAVVVGNIRDDIGPSEFVKSLSAGTKIPDDVDYKKEYGAYLERKYS